METIIIVAVMWNVSLSSPFDSALESRRGLECVSVSSIRHETKVVKVVVVVADSAAATKNVQNQNEEYMHLSTLFWVEWRLENACSIYIFERPIKGEATHANCI